MNGPHREVPAPSALPGVRIVDDAPLDRRDRPLRELRLSLIDRCNFRCPYCMPEAEYPSDHRFLPSAARMSLAEILDLVAIAVDLGVRKLRLTGGEPLLYRDLLPLLAQLRTRWPSLELALTTNGSRLAPLAAALREAGLNRITVSLDALDPQRFATLSGGRGEVVPVLEGLAVAVAAGFAAVKVNCVVMRGVNEDQVLPLIEHFRGSGIELRFIEYMDVGTRNRWRRSEVVTATELREQIARSHPLLPLPRNSGAVAQRWSLADGTLHLGFVAAISEPFCADCSRARLSADGQFHTCLFSARGTPMLATLRTHGVEAVRQRMIHVWQQRDDQYSVLRDAALDAGARPAPRMEMYHLGG